MHIGLELAAVKLTARYYRYDYLRRFLYHKVNPALYPPGDPGRDGSSPIC
ncbi:MAG: hypothetical protein ACLR23_12210 [Clostridia bacterium]